MALTEKISDIRRSAFRNHPSQAAFPANDETADQALPATGSDLLENFQTLREERDSLRREHAILQQAIFEAAQIQRRLCAPRDLSWGEFEIAGEIFPVRHLSGDFFKVMQLNSALGLAVGDIAGKGLSAGIWQTHLMALIQRCARKHANPAAAVAEVNRALCGDHGEPPLTALFFARMDSRNNELAYCNAGLPSPLLFRHDKSVERLEAGGPMLGALKNAAFDSGSVTLHPGDMLLAYSDGVTECRNSQDEEFEMHRLSSAATAVRGASANQALFSTIGAVLDFAGDCSPFDDLTLLVVRRREGSNPAQSRSRPKNSAVPRRRSTSLMRPKNATGECTVPKC